MIIVLTVECCCDLYSAGRSPAGRDPAGRDPAAGSTNQDIGHGLPMVATLVNKTTSAKKHRSPADMKPKHAKSVLEQPKPASAPCLASQFTE